jgi:tagatose-6-phosphate ketose/aldose isomerase
MTAELARHATWREIMAQPAIWRDWAGAFDPAALRAWVAGLGVDEVWFCGAGSSAYIGDMIVASLEGQPGPRLRAIPTTDIVARPHAYLQGHSPLIVSFGRSGNSAETIGTLDALDVLAPRAPRLNITCNAGSALATRHALRQRTIVLPPATHDAGFAMTSSLTTMLLTALAIFGPPPDLPALATHLTRLLPRFTAHATAARTPDRVVFVGSGPLACAAREAALKVMELSAGAIPALWDSTLGFRHGPKSFVRGTTDIYVFGATHPHTARYDADLVAELRAQFPASSVTLAGPTGDIDMPTEGAAFLLPIVLAQILAVVWSDRAGLPVDDPFAGLGTLSRVVSGVQLYPVTA